jgi:hypothetical protein
MNKGDTVVDSELPQVYIDQVAAEVTMDWLHPKLREAGIEDPERYVISYVRDEPEPVQGFMVTLSPEDEAQRARIMKHISEVYGIPEVADEP